MGEILLVRFSQHLVPMWLIYDLNSPNLSIRYDLGTVLARVRGGATCSKMSTFQIVPHFGYVKFEVFAKLSHALTLARLSLALLPVFPATRPGRPDPADPTRQSNFVCKLYSTKLD